MTTTDTMFATVQHEISEQEVRDLLCSAWEGGSTYWCGVKTRKISNEAHRTIRKQKRERGEFYGHDYPFVPGVDVILEDTSGEAEETDHPEPWILNRAKLIAGLQVMATKYPRHFSNFLTGDGDAETGDVYLQCCLFNEIVFG